MATDNWTGGSKNYLIATGWSDGAESGGFVCLDSLPGLLGGMSAEITKQRDKTKLLGSGPEYLGVINSTS